MRAKRLLIEMVLVFIAIPCAYALYVVAHLVTWFCMGDLYQPDPTVDNLLAAAIAAPVVGFLFRKAHRQLLRRPPTFPEQSSDRQYRQP